MSKRRVSSRLANGLIWCQLRIISFVERRVEVEWYINLLRQPSKHQKTLDSISTHNNIPHDALQTSVLKNESKNRILFTQLVYTISYVTGDG